jgi:integrase
VQVIAFIGLSGACRCDELKNMTIDDIQDTQSVLIINIPDSKTGKSRVFTVVAVKNELANDLNLIEIYRKYVSLRSPLTEHRRLFVNYQKGKCTVQPVGINKFAKVPAIIANYLKIPDASSYTGHCWRRTSASLLVDAGADLLTLKSHGGWKSSAVAEGYIENSIQNKISIATKILGNNLSEKPNRIANVASTSSSVSTHYLANKSDTVGVSIHAENCTFNFYNTDKKS